MSYTEDDKTGYKHYIYIALGAIVGWFLGLILERFGERFKKMHPEEFPEEFQNIDTNSNLDDQSQDKNQNSKNLNDLRGGLGIVIVKNVVINLITINGLPSLGAYYCAVTTGVISFLGLSREEKIARLVNASPQLLSTALITRHPSKAAVIAANDRLKYVGRCDSKLEYLFYTLMDEKIVAPTKESKSSKILNTYTDLDNNYTKGRDFSTCLIYILTELRMLPSFESYFILLAELVKSLNQGNIPIIIGKGILRVLKRNKFQIDPDLEEIVSKFRGGSNAFLNPLELTSFTERQFIECSLNCDPVISTIRLVKVNIELDKLVDNLVENVTENFKPKSFSIRPKFIKSRIESVLGYGMVALLTFGNIFESTPVTQFRFPSDLNRIEISRLADIETNLDNTIRTIEKKTEVGEEIIPTETKRKSNRLKKRNLRKRKHQYKTMTLSDLPPLNHDEFEEICTEINQSHTTRIRIKNE